MSSYAVQCVLWCHMRCVGQVCMRGVHICGVEWCMRCGVSVGDGSNGGVYLCVSVCIRGCVSMCIRV